SARVPTFQVDRAKLDSHMLERAVAMGCDLWRPAKVSQCDLAGSSGQTLRVTVAGDERKVTARWLVDASGRATFLARKLGCYRPNLDHPINSVWARFTGVKDCDSYDWREKFPDYMDACHTLCYWGTNHLFG